MLLLRTFLPLRYIVRMRKHVSRDRYSLLYGWSDTKGEGVLVLFDGEVGIIVEFKFNIVVVGLRGELGLRWVVVDYF